MRITFDLDDDVHQAVKRIAAEKKQTMGRVLSDLIRHELETKPPPVKTEDQHKLSNR